MVHYDTIEKALEQTNSPRILLLGNGFSQCCMKKFSLEDNFNYKKLIDKIKDKKIKSLFNEKLGICDFEQLVQEIELISRLQFINGRINDKENIETTIDRLNSIIEDTKKSFISVINTIHPKNSNEILPGCEANAKFLEKFDTIFTLNYDLLLYWSQREGDSLKDKFKDGFRKKYIMLITGIPIFLKQIYFIFTVHYIYLMILKKISIS
jgi:hypothetical protein